jgi:hypothetical protein
MMVSRRFRVDGGHWSSLREGLRDIQQLRMRDLLGFIDFIGAVSRASTMENAVEPVTIRRLRHCPHHRRSATAVVIAISKQGFDIFHCSACESTEKTIFLVQVRNRRYFTVAGLSRYFSFFPLPL